MAQQVNLRTPILLAQKLYFSAQTMAVALAVFLVLGSALCFAWVWRLNESSARLEQTVSGFTQERERLQAAIQAGKAGAGPALQALKAELAARRQDLANREGVLSDLRRGLLEPGQGHAARMRAVAQSIPAQVWVTEMSADVDVLEVYGLTLEPAALNDWVKRLASQPLFSQQVLATVKVERAQADVQGRGAGGAAPAPGPGTAAPAPVASAKPALWSYTLRSALANRSGTQSAAPGPAYGATP